MYANISTYMFIGQFLIIECICVHTKDLFLELCGGKCMGGTSP